MTTKYNIACLGEILWDILPDQELPGGAPMNVAYHLQKLSQYIALWYRPQVQMIMARGKETDEQHAALYRLRTNEYRERHG